MRIERLQKLSATPWAITPHALRVICAQGEKEVPSFDTVILGVETLPYEVDEGVAVIDVAGIIDKDVSPIDALFGSIDVDDIRADIEAAISDPDVRGIVLDFDSPGGCVTGVPELASYIAEASNTKPIVAFTDSMMCSAAYWLAAGATAIVTSQTAEIGSIGVYLATMDLSKLYESMGVKVDVIKSGDLKAAGYPGTAMTDEQRADYQGHVDHVFEMFKGHVTAHRPVSDESMRGQSMMADVGVGAGLSDSIGMLWDATALARVLGRA